jgi:subtilisin family serine protease
VSPLELVRLDDLMERGQGRPEITVALIDGPVALKHPELAGAITVASAGNRGTVGGSAITRNRSVVPVVACNVQGWPLAKSNLGRTIGRWGLLAPGENITSLGTNDNLQIFGGTSAAAPFVSGTIALLWSAFPSASSPLVRLAISRAGTSPRNSVVPPLLDAWAAYQTMASAYYLRKP